MSNNTLKKIARNNNVSKLEVHREMQIAIKAARKSTCPTARAFWDSLPNKGEDLTPEKFIEHITLLAQQGGIKHARNHP